MADETVTAVDDQAPAVVSPADDTQAAPAPEQTDKAAVRADDTAEDESLLSEEELAKYKDEPAKQIKAMQRAFTQKTQALAREREELKGLRQFKEAFQANPKETVKWLAQQQGLTIAEAKAQAEAVAGEAVDPRRALLEQQFGKEAADVILATAEAIANKAVESKVKPLEEHRQQILAEAALKDTQAALERMTKEFPDWRKYEKAMTELGQKLDPRGLDEYEYAKLLYNAVREPTAAADQASKVVAQINKAAATAEPIGTGVAPSRVMPAIPENATFDDAVKAAKRGDDWRARG